MLKFLTFFERIYNVKYPIVQPYLPKITSYQERVEQIFEKNWLTNNGPLVRLLEERLAKYLGVDYILLVANGTLALQVTYRTLNVTGKVFTTPFSFAATATSLLWEGITPIFLDIESSSLNLDISKIADFDDEEASAILAVHVFGNPCQVKAIDRVAKDNDLKVIYDAAHAFSSDFNDTSVLNYGDASILSFHATKLFHSIEGGAIIFKDKLSYEKAKQIINFGFDKNNLPQYVGINAKMSEFHAAMGLAVLDDIEHITSQRRLLVNRYYQKLVNNELIQLQEWSEFGECNGAYMPIILPTEEQLLLVIEKLALAGIQTRRYFYPSLSQVNAYCGEGETPIGNDISSRILCLPMYTDLKLLDVDFICETLINILNTNESIS